MPKTAKRLTKKDLDRLLDDAKAGRDRTLADTQAGLYAQGRRKKVRFLFRYRAPGGGGRRTLNIDFFGNITLDQARTAALKLRGQVAVDRQDPQVVRAAERADASTFADAAEGYLQDLARRAATRGGGRGKPGGFQAMRGLLQRHALPRLGAKRLKDITPEDVRRLHRAMAEIPTTANRALTAIQAVFSWADGAGLVPEGMNPATPKRVRRYPEEGQRRALTPDELTALGEALHAAEKAKRVHQSVALAVKLLALTGMRRSEVLNLKWSDVDFEQAVVTLTDSKTGPCERAIGAAAVELLRKAKPHDASGVGFVCPGEVAGQPYIGIDKARRRLWTAAGIVSNGKGRADLHSLRHSFASVGASVRGGAFVGHVAPLLGHGFTGRSVTNRYIGQNVQALRVAADAIAGEVARLLGLGEAAAVLAFPKAKR